MLIWPLLLLPFMGTAQSIEKACFSVPGGFYEESPTLEIFPFYQQHHIRFTTNGNCPTAQARRYTEPLLLDESLYSTSDIYTINLTPDSVVFIPDSVRHCIVIRAAVFDENDSCISEVATNSYFIRSLGCDTHGIPVVSLCADSLSLFDFDNGIMVPGAFFNPDDPLYTGNYYQTGLDWERQANVEYYENGQNGINQMAGLRTQGEKSRRFQQKAVKIYAREVYGKKRFEYRFFNTIPHNSFKHLTLKPFRASWNETGINDYISNRIASHLNLETLASRPVVLFLNGEYWGIYFLHEKPDERYLEDHLGVDPDRVNILNGWDFEVDCGSPVNYQSLYHWFLDADLCAPEAYAYVRSKIDMDNFIDYYIFELFAENTDWPNNNTRFWQEGNGPFRWIFFDGDACLSWVTFNAFENAVYDGNGTYPSSWNATLFFRKLFANNNFRQRFNQRFLELLNTTFSYERTGPVFEEIKSTLAPEIPWQSERFGYPTDVETWNTFLGHTQWFLRKRHEYLLPVLESFMHWSVPEMPQVSFAVFPNPSNGPIHLSVYRDMDGEATLQVFDGLGRQVKAERLSLKAGSNVLSLELSLVPGLYYLKIDQSVTKIVRQ